MSNAQTDYSRLSELAGNLGLHEHLCLIYDTEEEQMATAIPYLRTGLERGEKCLYLADENTVVDVLEALRKSGTNVESYLRQGALATISKNDFHLKTGRFDPDLVIGYWADATTQAKADGFPGLRVLAEMTWTFGEIGAPVRLLELESQINHMYHDYDAAGLCQYNRARFAPDVILGVLRTHPLVVYGGLVSKNPYYVPPEEFLKPNQPALEVERLLHNILEAEQARQTLRRSEERWRSVFENSAIGVALTDLSGRFLVTNPVYQKMVGYTEQELRALAFLELTHEDYREANRALVIELLEGKRKQFQIEKKYRRKDGALIWVSNNVSLVPGSERVPRFIMALSEDITERKRAVEKLRESEEQFRQFAEHRRDIVSIISLDGRELIYLNLAFEEITGRRREETLTPSDCFDIIHPEDRGRALKSMREQAEGSTQEGAEFRIVRPDGTIRWVRTRVFPIRNNQGVVYRLGGITHDFTERRRAEEELRNSEERFRTLFESVQVGVVVTDPHAETLMANRAALDILGVTEEQLVGSSSYDPKWHTFYEDGSPCPPSEHPIPRVIDTRQPVRSMVLGVDRPVLEDRIWLLVNATPQCAPDGSVSRVVCAFLDITERKRAEDALRRQKEILQKIFDNSPIMISFAGADGRIELVNREWARTIGWTLKEIREQNLDIFAEIYPDPQYRQKVLEFVAAADGKFADFRIRTREGRLIDTTWVRVRLSDGTTIGIGRDITERKRAEEGLRRSEAYLAAGQRLSHTGSWAWNLATGELFWSEEAFRIFGFDPAKTKPSIAETFLQRIHPEDRAKIERGVQEASTELKNYEVDYRILLPDGSVKYIHDVVYTVTNGAGRVVERYGVVMDVTERRQAEEKIERLRSQLEMERDYLREEVKESQAFGEILGRSEALQKVLRQVDLVAPTDATVLILGESGTGKELVARAIHQRSPRRDQPLVKVNCGSIPRDLFESEFFGHVKGAFTGALRNRVGRFELADRGTIFLDEVSEIPLELQSKLLRVLQEGEFERLGEETTRHVDVRVIAATNRDLQKEVELGRFRLDLFHRLAVFPLQIPPLRERREDIPILAAHFLELICSRSNLPRPRLRQRDIKALERYDWPGNVRELQNVIERAVILARDGPLQLDLPGSSTAEQRPQASPVRPSDEADILTDEEWRAKERENLERALRRARGRISGPHGAAAILGVHPNTLAYRMRALGLNRKS